jgi:hypothetical protein
LSKDRESARRRTAKDDVWDACEEALGYGPLTKTEKALWGKSVSSLHEAGATPDRIAAVAKWYRRHWPGIDLTITSLEKWYSHFLRMEEKKVAARATVCPECGIGGGQHAADCPTLDGG